MKLATVLVLVVLAVACVAGRSSAETDPRCANIDLDSHTVRALTNEMQGFVDTNDTNSARYVYQSGVRMALGDYDLPSHCGNTFDLSSMDAAFEQLVEQAYDDKIIGAGEAQFWMRSLLAGANGHGDTRDQVDAWTAFEHQLAAESAHRFQRPPH